MITLPWPLFLAGLLLGGVVGFGLAWLFVCDGTED